MAPVPLIAVPFVAPMFFLPSVGHSSKDLLHIQTLALAERMCERQKHSPTYEKAVMYTQWKLTQRYKRDFGYKARLFLCAAAACPVGKEFQSFFP